MAPTAKQTEHARKGIEILPHGAVKLTAALSPKPNPKMQASHLAGNLYGAQLQQPLAGPGQHFQNPGLQANQGYASYPPNQGYNNANYGMGGAQGRQQYPNFYPRE